MAITFSIENIVLNRKAETTLHRQLYQQLRRLVERRILPSGTGLPATRQLARDLMLGRNTVIAAYEQLAVEGFITIAHGKTPLVNGLPLHHELPPEKKLPLE